MTGVCYSGSNLQSPQHSEYVLELPIHFVGNAALCAASAVRFHMLKYPASMDGPVFWQGTYASFKPVLYSTVLSHKKLFASSIGIAPEEVGCHSLRRSGAAHMHSIGIPLVDIMSWGDWKSMSVLQYLVTPASRKVEIQHVVAGSLSV